MSEQNVRTSELLRRLFKTANINHFIKRHGRSMESVPFYIYLNRLCADKDAMPAHIIKKSGIAIMRCGILRLFKRERGESCGRMVCINGNN
jgi:hypothetical protein